LILSLSEEKSSFVLTFSESIPTAFCGGDFLLPLDFFVKQCYNDVRIKKGKGRI